MFVPDFTFFSSGEIVSAIGATPVFVDVEEDTFNICPNSLQRQIEWVINNTNLNMKAIVAVDLFGDPANHPEIRKIADKYHMYVLEDGAQGFGGSIGSKKACSFGDISTTSFFPAKPLGCYGDGGAVFTDNDEWAEIIRSLKVHGKGADKYDNIRIGMNSRLDTIQAAILLEKLKFFDEEIDKCNRVADMYMKYMPQDDRIVLPTIKQGHTSSWAQYTILLESGELRNDAMSKLKENCIPSMIYYKKPMHMQKAFEILGVGMDDYANTTSICQRCLSLPMSAYIEEEDVKRISVVFSQLK